jgi:hypothetical protein
VAWECTVCENCPPEEESPVSSGQSGASIVRRCTAVVGGGLAAAGWSGAFNNPWLMGLLTVVTLALIGGVLLPAVWASPGRQRAAWQVLQLLWGPRGRRR